MSELCLFVTDSVRCPTLSASGRKPVRPTLRSRGIIFAKMPAWLTTGKAVPCEKTSTWKRRCRCLQGLTDCLQNGLLGVLFFRRLIATVVVLHNRDAEEEKEQQHHAQRRTQSDPDMNVEGSQEGMNADAFLKGGRLLDEGRYSSCHEGVSKVHHVLSGTSDRQTTKSNIGLLQESTT